MEFIGDIARKTGDPSLLAVEAMKSEKAAEIGRSSGLFYVPGVLNFDREKGQLDFERLDGLSTLFDLAIKEDDCLNELMNRTGRALAVVHEQLLLPETMKHPLPAEWMDNNGENVFVHGDLAMINVGFQREPERLVIMDWSGAPILGRTPSFGSRYFDVLWFVNCIFHTAPYGSYRRWNAEAMAGAFLTGYTDAISAKNPNEFKTYLPAISMLQKKNIRYMAGHKPLLKAIGYTVYQRIVCRRLLSFLNNYDL